MAHKVKHFKDFIPNAFPNAENLIIDAEVLLVDNKTGLPLPFGTLGVHKGSDFKDADPCLFVFDCIFYNGENLMNRPLKNRREFLVNNMIEVGNRIKLSEIKKNCFKRGAPLHDKRRFPARLRRIDDKGSKISVRTRKATLAEDKERLLK